MKTINSQYKNTQKYRKNLLKSNKSPYPKILPEKLQKNIPILNKSLSNFYSPNQTIVFFMKSCKFYYQKLKNKRKSMDFNEFKESEPIKKHKKNIKITKKLA